MAELNEWWALDPGERYWLEVTDRDDLGANLHAPKLDDGGKPYWSYNLVSVVQPGDVVFHWWKRGDESAIVASSIAVGEVTESPIVWTSHGSYGRTRGTGQPEPGWLMPLAEFAELEDPVTLSELRQVEPAIRDVRERLATTITGPMYFPFALSDKRPLRATQGYLLKMPTALVAAIPGLVREVPPSLSIERASSSGRAPRSARRPARGSGYIQDSVLRKALERHAVDWTLQHFEGLGYEVDDVGTRQPYDVLALSESEELHIEVKGSSGSAVTVELTDGEVGHHRSHADGASILVVVDEIQWERVGESVKTSGGRVRIWPSWVPDEASLVPIRYRHTLADGWRSTSTPGHGRISVG